MLYKECPIQETRVFRLTIIFLLGTIFLACSHSTGKFLARGEEYLKKRKFHDALMQFRAAAETDQDSAMAHWGLARAYENLGQFNEALDELRKSVELDENNLDAQARLGNYFLLVQPPLIPEAEKIQEKITAKDPNFIEGQILKASILASQNRPESEVVRKIEQAIGTDPKRIETYISLSRYYMTKEKAAEAEAAIQRGITADPTKALGMTEYGRFLMYADRNEEAEKQFNLAIAAEPEDIEAHEAIAEFFTATRQYAKAEAAYKVLVQIQENSPESRLELADFYANTHRQEDAIATLEQIITDSPDYVLARYRIGQIYLDRKQSDKVNEQLDALFKINDNDSEARLLRARLEISENRSDDAVKDLESILKKQPSHREALFYIAQAKLELGQIDQAKAFIADLEQYHSRFLRTWLLKIRAAMASGETAEALRFANELYDKAGAATANADTNSLALQDLQSKALTARGLAYLALGRRAEALATLQGVANDSPNSSSANVNLAKATALNNDQAGALEIYEKALDLDPSNFDALSGYVNVSISLQRQKAGHSKVDDAIERNAGRADVLAALHYLKSTIFSSSRDSVSAENELKTSIDLDPDYLPAYPAYASLLVARNETAAAIEQYEKVVQMKPSAPAYTVLGILEDSRGEYAVAEKHYRKALEIAPESSIAANNLAWLIVETQGNLDEALQLSTQAVSKNQTVAGFYDTLGYIYFKKGLYSPAVEQLRKAVALDESSNHSANPGYRVRLSMALASSGDKASARREVETSLRSQSEMTEQEVSDAKSLLSKL